MTRTDPTQCDSTDCGCGVPRRSFLQLTGAGALALLVRSTAAMAGPFESADFQHLVPEDKKLRPEWVKSLFERGTPTIYRGADLKYIGMPVGGITTGQLYLGGDGKLWHWDVMNNTPRTWESHYANPVEPSSPLAQGFSLSIRKGNDVTVRSLDAKGFSDVSFMGQYPIGTVEYRDGSSPISVTLEAFSPFIPLSVDDSSLPATILHFTLKNTGSEPVDAELTGYLENAIGLHSNDGRLARANKVARDGDRMLRLDCLAHARPEEAVTPNRLPIVFEDFEGTNYGQWKVEGTAFGKGPATGAGPEGLRGFMGKSLASSWAALSSDEPQGKLISPEFQISRRYINFLIAGGNHPHRTCIDLVIDGKTVETATGKNSHVLKWHSWDVGKLEGKRAHLEIVDQESGGWGHIQVDQIELADAPKPLLPVEKLADFGTMSLALLATKDADRAMQDVAVDRATGAVAEIKSDDSGTGRPIGALTRKLLLAPGASQEVIFVLAWNFPNLRLDNVKEGVGRHYATRFPTAAAAASYVADNFDRLASATRLWRDTFYDSTLPFWFLDRTLLNLSVLATSTAFRLANGRFYAWEGVGCCGGTCTHVWQYEQGMGRLFPELDKLLRQWADFNPDVGMNPDGMIDHRGELHAGQAIDGQAGIILRAYRDHQMSSDDGFLRKFYPSIKKAMQWMIDQDALDGVEDGILRGPQHNTLDVEWYGPVAWLSGLYLAALRAAEAMAGEMGDREFAAHCRKILDVGVPTYVKLLFNGEYFMNLPDPKHLDAINSGSGCEIDQVMGQGWAFQVGLGRLLPEKETRAALKSLWKYNFAPDVGPYRAVNKPGRWYAMPGEAGLLICTFPRADWSYDQAKGKGPEWAAQYFNECQNGYEHEAASHMIWEGLLLEGFAVERAIHDRYHASRRNPWNEVECGDHYARSMASYGLFVAACGYEYHGPQGHLGFAPRLTPENFKGAFTTAEGWGAFSQQANAGSHKAQVEIKWGRLKLNTLSLKLPEKWRPANVVVTLNANVVKAQHAITEDRLTISFPEGVTIEKDQRLEASIS